MSRSGDNAGLENYAPEGVGISNENIADTLQKELEKLAVLYHYMKKA